MSKKASLADKISSILSTAPASFNPDEEDNEETAAKLTEGAFAGEDDEDDLLIGSFRRQNAELLEDIDVKYAGRKSSRKRLRDSDDDLDSKDESDGDDYDEDDADSNLTDEDGTDQENEVKSSSESGEGEEDNDSEENDEHENEDELSVDDEEGISFDDATFQHMKEQDVPAQMKKGLSVRNQLNMWESLLEMRIQMQKCLVAANKMPQKDHYAAIAKDSGNEFTAKVNETKKSLSGTLEKLLELQSLVWKKYPETRALLKRNDVEKMKNNDKGSDEEIPSESEVEISEEEELEDEKPRKRIKLTDYENDINERHKKYKAYRNSVVQKWNDKTRMGTLKSATAAHSVLNQIDHILTDRTRLIKRTQTKKSNYEIVGIQEPTIENEINSNLECSTEIFDDDDFYHQLLRELIEVKSAGVTDPIQLGRQWIQLQNLRSKMKRKIDTRATKGRKIRYTVHSKLVNFMAPMDEGTYTDDAKTELFSSLFGKKLGLQNSVV